MSRKQKRMGPVGCFGQIENIKRQSLHNHRNSNDRLGTRAVGYGYKSNHPAACGAAGWNEKEYMEKE